VCAAATFNQQAASLLSLLSNFDKLANTTGVTKSYNDDATTMTKTMIQTC